MVQSRVGFYWRITWGIITPITLVVIFLYFLATLQRLTYANYEYPDFILGMYKRGAIFKLCITITIIFFFIKYNSYGILRFNSILHPY